jgi:hypothetical protein
MRDETDVLVSEFFMTVPPSVEYARTTRRINGTCERTGIGARAVE